MMMRQRFAATRGRLRPGEWVLLALMTCCVGAPQAAAQSPPAEPESTGTAEVTEAAEVQDATDSPEAQAKGVILPLHNEITDITFSSLKRRIQEAQELGVSVIVFELDTPGGYVSAALDIADLIKNLADIKTVAWVNTDAHSGGALVAVACDEIVMARSSRMGDSQVIMGGPTGPQAIPEELKAKATTPVLAEFRASAQLNGYSQVLCEAFVVPEREVWWVEHIESGEREFVLRHVKLNRIGHHVDDDTSIFGTPGQPVEDPEWKLVETYFDPVLGRDVDTIQPVVRDDQLLEMSASEAYAYGFNKQIVADESELLARYQLDSLTSFDMTWSEGIAFFLTSMYVRMFLLIVVFMAAYVEFHTPGVGVAGLVAILALALFVVGPYTAGLANVWELALILVGLLLLALEIFIIPGVGVAGIAGVVFIILGLLGTFIPRGIDPSPFSLPSWQYVSDGLKAGIVALTGSMVASLIGMVILGRYLPKFEAFKLIAPSNPTPSDVRTDDPYHGLARVGDVGVAQAPLRPAGKAQFGSTLVDVVSQGEMIDQDTRVEVIERRGNRVVVRAVS